MLDTQLYQSRCQRIFVLAIGIPLTLLTLMCMSGHLGMLIHPTGSGTISSAQSLVLMGETMPFLIYPLYILIVLFMVLSLFDPGRPSQHPLTLLAPLVATGLYTAAVCLLPPTPASAYVVAMLCFAVQLTLVTCSVFRAHATRAPAAPACRRPLALLQTLGAGYALRGFNLYVLVSVCLTLGVVVNSELPFTIGTVVSTVIGVAGLVLECVFAGSDSWGYCLGYLVAELVPGIAFLMSTVGSSIKSSIWCVIISLLAALSGLVYTSVVACRSRNSALSQNRKMAEVPPAALLAEGDQCVL